MGRDLGILSPVEYAVSCEAKQDMFRQVALIPRSPSLSLRLSEPSLNPNPNPTPTEQERNALICGASLFLWFVLRRLVDIQGKLHESRAMHKAVGGVPTGGVPMGMPVGKPGKPLKGE